LFEGLRQQKGTVLGYLKGGEKKRIENGGKIGAGAPSAGMWADELSFGKEGLSFGCKLKEKAM